ncbi:MAG: hypothetical protein ACW99G_11435 [Candidatus Thorarchaeota archaeon]|jgi:hypothetical protein
MNDMDYLDELEAIAKGLKPQEHGNLLLRKDRRDEAIRLASLLTNPADVMKYKEDTQTRLRAERIWRRFGRNIDVRTQLEPDGFLKIFGNPHHVGAYLEYVLP